LLVVRRDGCVMPGRRHVCYRLRVKSVTSVAEAYTTQPNRKAAVEYCTVYLNQCWANGHNTCVSIKCKRNVYY
jgi:hypothetical protein